MRQFHSFRLDTVNHCLWRGESRQALTPKAFDVLRYLVEHAERLVTQEELLEALWPETYVNHEVIKKYILGIRKVLGDRHENPEFIRTFPRRGYQFIAPVSAVESADSSALCISQAKHLSLGESALERLGGNIGRALMSRQQVVFLSGETEGGKTSIVRESAQSVTPMTAVLIVFVSEPGANQECRRQR